MTLKKMLLLSFFFISSLAVYAQAVDTLKSILNKKPHPFIALDGHYSFISSNPAQILGVRVGLSFQKKIRLGLGFYTLHTILKRHIVLSEIGGISSASLRFWYISPVAEYVYYQKAPWQFSVPVTIGLGNSHYVYAANDEKRKLYNHAVVVYEPMVSGHYKLMKYIGIGFGAGIRFVLIANREMKEKFTSPVFALNLKIFLGDIYSSLFSQGKKTYKYGEG